MIFGITHSERARVIERGHWRFALLPVMLSDGRVLWMQRYYTAWRTAGFDYPRWRRAETPEALDAWIESQEPRLPMGISATPARPTANDKEPA